MDYLAIVATCLSIISIIFTFSEKFRKPKIKAYIAEYCRMIVDENGNLGLHLPITFVNSSTNLGVIDRVKLTITNLSTSKEYLVDWESFCKTEGEEWKRESQIYPIAVEGKKDVSKIITFMQYKDETVKFAHLENGIHRVKINIYKPGSNNSVYSNSYFFDYTDEMGQKVGKAAFESFQTNRWKHINLLINTEN